MMSDNLNSFPEETMYHGQNLIVVLNIVNSIVIREGFGGGEGNSM